MPTERKEWPDRPAVWLTLRLHREPARLLEGRAATVESEVSDEL